MSVMQVVGSSRISNTAYLGVASIYWTLFITLIGFPLNLDVQTALILVTPPAGIAAFLWILRIEEYTILRILLGFLPRYKRGTFIRFHMGHTILHLQSWKEALLEEGSIVKSLQQEVRRTLRSPLLKEEMEGLYQLFWLVFSTPPLFLVLRINLPEYTLIFDIISLTLVLLSLLITLYRKRAWPMRVLGFSFCSWTLDTISTSARRRESFGVQLAYGSYPRGAPSYFPLQELSAGSFQNKTEPWLKEISNHANSEDWHGFDMKLTSFLESQIIGYNRNLLIDSFNSLVTDIIWAHKRTKIIGLITGRVILNFDRVHPPNYLGMAKRIVLDAIIEVEKEISMDPHKTWNSNLRDFLSKWDSMESWEDIFSIISQNIISQLTPLVLQALAELPYFMNDKTDECDEICKFRGHERLLVLDVILCLQRAVDRKYISPLVVFKAATEWGILPRTYIKDSSPHVRSLILEVETNLPAIELKKVMTDVLLKSPNIDTDKVASNLLRYKNDSEFENMLKMLQNIGRKYPTNKVGSKAKEILVKMGIDDEKSGVIVSEKK
ncbi:MAG: hypothetical protein P1Q69_02070 [Candidatus Thorarchaeota archaeon]|nr:hypothetical protein [Candidatus Thorarchaeota archaeon]